MESPDIDVFKLKLRPPPLYNQNDKDNDMILGAKHFASEFNINNINNNMNNSNSMKEKIDKDEERLYDNNINKSNNISNILSINQNNNEPIEINEIMKILIVGNAKCGKSSIINRYTSNSFESKYKTTIGADFIRKDVSLELSNNKTIGVRLQLWDIAGQDRFQKLTRAYFNNAKGVVIVCDVSREGTIDAVRTWKREIDDWADKSNYTNIPVILFANKSDLLTNPQDAFRTGAVMERVCREQDFLGWFITSAKNGDCINDGFNTLMSKIIDIQKAKDSTDENLESKKQTSIKLQSKTFKISKNMNNRKPRLVDTDCC